MSSASDFEKAKEIAMIIKNEHVDLKHPSHAIVDAVEYLMDILKSESGYCPTSMQIMQGWEKTLKDSGYYAATNNYLKEPAQHSAAKHF